MSIRPRFEAKKQRILAQLGIPEYEYHDLSPKGSIDESIRPLIGDINRLEGLVTTSSCSGRISVFLEGKKKSINSAVNEEVDEAARAGPGGKGGGSWLYISHSPADISHHTSDSPCMAMFGLRMSNAEDAKASHGNYRCIHLKFEPMVWNSHMSKISTNLFQILHILTASLDDAHRVLTAALSSGFRESGAVSLNASNADGLNPMVAVRSTGYSFDAIIGFQSDQGDNIALVDETYLQTLIGIANERFKTNDERISRFRSALLEQYASNHTSALLSKAVRPEWEDSEARRQRKREEGLARKQQLHAQPALALDRNMSGVTDDVSLGGMFD